MAVISGFFDAVIPEGGTPDRKYSADDFGAIFDGVISDGIFQKFPDSVYDSTTDTWSPFKVVPSTNAVDDHLEVCVNPGRAWFDKTWTLLEETEFVKLDLRDAGLDRIDGIYILVDKNNRKNQIYVHKGEESAHPTFVPKADAPNEYYHLIAKVYIKNSSDTGNDAQIIASDITNMIGESGGAPYVKSNVTDPNITTQTILKNLENSFDAYQSQYTDSFEKWFQEKKDYIGNISPDQIIEVAEMVADTYSTDYLSGGYPYTNDDCLYLSSEKSVLPPVIVNFGFVSSPMYPNAHANEETVYTDEIDESNGG